MPKLSHKLAHKDNKLYKQPEIYTKKKYKNIEVYQNRNKM